MSKLILLLETDAGRIAAQAHPDANVDLMLGKPDAYYTWKFTREQLVAFHARLGALVKATTPLCPVCEMPAHPRLAAETLVKTVDRDMDSGWADNIKPLRKWDVLAQVLNYGNEGHGEYYVVLHDDGTRGYYDPCELEVVS